MAIRPVRWLVLPENFRERLSENLRARLTVENDDRESLYTVQDLTYLHEQIGIPIVFDYFHHSLNPGQQDVDIVYEARMKEQAIRRVNERETELADVNNTLRQPIQSLARSVSRSFTNTPAWEVGFWLAQRNPLPARQRGGVGSIAGCC
jgi:hypothetical protein